MVGKASTIAESAIPRRFLAIRESVVKLQKVQCFSYTNRQQTEMVVSGCISLEALEWKRFAHVAKQRRLEKVNQHLVSAICASGQTSAKRQIT